jgi:hypothetical protein
VHRQEDREPCQRRLPSGDCASTSRTTASARRSRSTRSGVTSPTIRTASPAGERLATDQLVRETELASDAPHLVLEQLAQRLDQLELHALGRPPTLWCVLIVADGPRTDTDSMTSG